MRKTKMIRRNLIFVLVLIVASPIVATAQTEGPPAVDVSQLLNDVEFWLNKRVQVEGDVRDVVVLEAGYVYYKLTDFAGDDLWVKKEARAGVDYPVLNTKVTAIGTVRANSDYNLSDAEIILFEELLPAGGPGDKEQPWWRKNLLLVILLAVFLVLFLALILVLLWPTFTRNRKPVVAAGSPFTVAENPQRQQSIEDPPMAGAPTMLTEQPTPVYAGERVGGGEMKTPFYYGHLSVEECSDADLVGKTFDLAFPGGKAEALVGRSNQADIRIPHKYLSRKHMRIQRKDDQLVILKVPGAKEVHVNGEPLEEQYGALLETGSTIVLPGIVLKVELG